MAEQEIVLLIHGTGAVPKEDEGELWWQVGSEFCKIVDTDLTPQARCHKKGEVFHWSGKNSEQDRRQAGIELFHHLLEKFETRPPHRSLLQESSLSPQSLSGSDVDRCRCERP